MRLLASCITLLLSTTIVSAQFAASASFLVGVPQGEFASNLGQNGYGIALTGEFAPPETPIRFGLNLGLMSYGADERREPFSTTIPDVTVEVSTTNNLILVNLEGRLQPNIGTFRPYVSGTFGMSILTTMTSIKNSFTSEEIASSTNKNDVAFNYGVGGGLNMRVWTNTEGEDPMDMDVQIRDVSIHIGGTYLKSGEAEYLKKGSIRNENGTAVYDVIKSRTDIILYAVGVSMTL